MGTIDPVELTRRLIRCPSVTPEEGGAIELLHRVMQDAGFSCTRVDRNGIANLYARLGGEGPVFGFNGHTDVVPVGNGWSVDPFGAELRDGRIWGRGACDMKSGVASFVAAAIEASCALPDLPGSIALLITGDEEGDGVDGTLAILDWMADAGERLDVCLVGEPTCPETFGEMMKIGRRGSMTLYVTARGTQGHAAYPHRARNPLPPLVAFLDRLARWRMDEGTAHFDASTLAITTIDVGNPANNVIPAEARATANIRFNDAHDSESIARTLKTMAGESETDGVSFELNFKVSGESFITEPGPFTDLVAQAVIEETGRAPSLSTSGGTSDARFIRAHCPVVEFGLVGQSMHKADEHASIADIHRLTRVYRRLIERYFATG